MNSTFDESILYKLPIEIWIQILKYVDLYSLTSLNCSNRMFNKMITKDKWFFVDNMIDSGKLLIPQSKETFHNYKYCIDWSHIILQNENTGVKIPENVIEWIDETNDLLMISTYQKFSKSLIYKLLEKISYKNLINNQDLPLDILYLFADSQTYSLNNTDWYAIWSKQTLNFDFIVKHIEHVQWNPLSSNKTSVSWELINQYHDKIVWQEFTKHSISEKILEGFISYFDFICWNNISRFTELSNDFIKKHLIYLDLGSIFRYQSLSLELLNTLVESFTTDEFIYYFQSILLYQTLSKEFIVQYKDKIVLKYLIRNKKIPRTVIHSIYG